ncbi:hypothetical protein MBAV_003518 [Candidatus Magnetobacterium bavaricum]|uniref:Uncharacterized protein n=1 Tax=Candidatus Magnetobacterium bavaricum TaxID=29290 RepID=A0A0F3GQW0_9BACT|nr:hypothetical protein MBAV_003518 [Candidatus Magnetobacterium bavaricum]
MKMQIDKGAIEYAEENALIKGRIEGRIEGKIAGKIEGLLEGERKGLIKGIEVVLDIKYGDKGTALMDGVRRLETVEELDEFKGLLKKSTSVDELWGYLKKT